MVRSPATPSCCLKTAPPTSTASPSHQGKGLGEKLFRHVERYCQDNAIPRLNLEIKETNYPLLKRYHGYGYKCFEVESGFYADGWGAIRMLKHFDV
jgi:ribosomal protein S18 acetylase RimI-like enzyme